MNLLNIKKRKLKYPNLMFFVLFCLFNISIANLSYGQAVSSSYVFVLNSPANVSAGVYSNDILIRKLWSKVQYNAGTYPIYWDGKDDNGNTVSSGSYVVKVLTSNVNYAWEGAHIGNSSLADTGATVHRVYRSITGINIIGSEAYYIAGFSERLPAVFAFNLSSPQVKVNIFPAGTTTPYTQYIASDGNNAYYAGYDPYHITRTFIYATKISDKSKVTFTTGVNYTLNEGDSYSVIGYADNSTSAIGGLAVYGNYVFYSHPQKDSIVVINKNTGAFVRTINIINPRNLACDGVGNMWVVSGTNTIAKYTINNDGSLTAANVTITGVITPGAISVNGSNVVIIDYATQQLKWFSNAAGSVINTFGQPGGYTANSTAANDKFCFKTVADGNLLCNLSFAADGSFWVVDPGNNRMQHFDSNRVYIESIYIPGSRYFTNVDAGNTTRVFGGGIEYAVNYSQALTGGTGWSFADNWGATIPATYDFFQGFKFVKTMTYGGVSHTFTMMVNSAGLHELIELIPNGIARFTGRIYPAASFIDDNNNLVEGLNRYAFTGFDGSNNPTWNNVAEVLADFSSLKNLSDLNLIAAFQANGGSSNFVTSDNKVVIYAPGNGNSNHLGAMQKGSNSFIWQTQKPTFTGYQGDFPPPEFFDIGNLVNNNAGSTVSVLGQNIITGYHGEGWKNSQTNIYNHYWSDGLALGQFGITAAQSVGEAAYGMDGNALSPQVVQGITSDVAYLYHGSEGTHGGVHRWKITGLNSIHEMSPINITYPSTSLVPPSAKGIDLMDGLVSGTTLTRGTNGWSGDGESNTSNNSFTTNIGLQAYDQSYPDLSIGFYNTSIGTKSISRVLQNVPATLSSWELSGKISFINTTPNNSGQGWSYLEILDDAGKIISRFSISFINGGSINQIYGNNKILLQDDYRKVNVLTNSMQQFSISVNSAILQFIYAGYSQSTATVVDNGANINRPTSLRFFFYSKGVSRYRTIDVKELRFINKASQTITFNSIGSKYMGTAPFILTAKSLSSSNLPITYSVLSGPATISGNFLTITGVGTVIIQANQAGNDLYDAATPVLQNFTVNPIRIDL